MKNVGVIFAMEEELLALKKYVRIEKEYNIFDLKFYEGEMNDIRCILVQSGIGKVNAARTTQVLIDNFKINCIFNIGVAGAVCEDLNIGDIVIGEKLVQHDFDITAFNHEKGYIPNVGVYVYSDKYLLELAKKVIVKSNLKIFQGVIASGDIFCSDYMMGKKINDKFNALCVEMEGASIAQVCNLCNVPFLILRSISDVPNNDNVVTYDEFLSDSCEKVANVMNEMLFELKIRES